MKKTHFRYLRRAVGLAIERRQSEQILQTLSTKRVPSNPVYGLIMDIVSDARFYYVTDGDEFWKLYSSDEIRSFIDSIDEEIWQDEERLTLHKEDFLNQWLSTNIAPMSEAERERKRRRALRSLQLAGLNDGINMSGRVADAFPIGIHDMTEPDDGEESGQREETSALGKSIAKNLPEEIQQLYQEPKGAGRGRGATYRAHAEFLKRIDPALIRLAMMIGRTGGSATRPTASRYGYGKHSDITGITVGDDLNSLLPIELAILATNETYDIFLRNYTRKRLQIFSSASQALQKDKGDRGPIIMCVDTSGSMSGQPEMMAKTLAMAIAIIVQGDKRPLLVVNYSHQVSFFVLTDLRRQWGRFMRFLSMSYSGGNDENVLFDFVFSLLPLSHAYNNIIRDFNEADLLVISDFIWMPVRTETAELIQRVHERGMRYFALEVGMSDIERLDWEDMPKNGEWFIQTSDHYFVYYKGELTQRK